MVAISFTGSSMLSSFLTIYKKETSKLNDEKLRWVKNIIHSNGFQLTDEPNSDVDVSEIISARNFGNGKNLKT